MPARKCWVPCSMHTGFPVVTPATPFLSQVSYADVLGVVAAQSHKLPYPIMTQVLRAPTRRGGGAPF